MRVIAGRWRGRRLQSPVGQAVRPTTDRAKEALFSMLGAQVQGATVIDLCCGAGGLGIEALSRGAERVLFVDSASASLLVAQKNLELCGCALESWQLMRADAVRWFRSWTGALGQPWLLLCDPPYASEIAGDVIRYVSGGDIPSDCVFAAVEHGPHTPGLATVPAGWQRRRYGISQVAIYRPSADNAEKESV